MRLSVSLLLLAFIYSTPSFKALLRCVAKRVFSVRLLNAVAFSKKLPWCEPTNVISFKTQLHAENDCRNSAEILNSLMIFIKEKTLEIIKSSSLLNHKKILIVKW
jgi:hypothetical protein